MKKFLLYIQAALMLVLCGCAATNNAGRLIDNTRGLDGMERAYKPYRSYYVDGRDVEFSDVDFIEKTLGEHDSEDSGTDIESRTRALGKRIEAIPGIISAAVVINGPTAIIGIRVQGSPESDILIEMKKKVKDLALTFDPDLTQAAVTATPELYERITGVAGKRTRISPDKRRLFPVVESL